jgi:hypothetical protein
VSEPSVPREIASLAEERSRARAARDWAAADDLRARIEQAGWRVIDSGTVSTLRPAHQPDEVVEGQRFHGSPASVPSRLAEPPAVRATIALLAVPADGRHVSVDDALAALAPWAPADVQVVVVAAHDVRATALHAELVGVLGSFTAAEALEAALRRSTGRLFIVLAPDRLVAGDIVRPIEKALVDPGVAVAGSEGLTSDDLRHFRPAPPGDVVALAAGVWAFRRSDAGLLDGLDPRLSQHDGPATWCSLALRDRGAGEPPRRAVALALPLAPRDDAASEDPMPGPDEHQARQLRRDGYRIAERFAGRDWLAAHGAAASTEEDVERAPQRADGEKDGEEAGQGEDAGEAQPGRSPRVVRTPG